MKEKTVMKIVKRIICFAIAAAAILMPENVSAKAEETGSATGRTPFSLVSTFADSPKTTRAFTWHTDSEIDESVVQAVPEAEYIENGESAFSGENLIEANGNCFAMQINPEGETRNIHKVLLSGLTPGTKYFCRAGGNGFWSEVFSFATEGENEDSFTFFSVTDTQAKDENNFKSYENYVKVLKSAAERFPEGAFVLHGGDMVLNNYFHHYDKVFELTKEYSAKLPIMLTAGNQELAKDDMGFVSGLDNINSRYYFPDNGPEKSFGTVYSFDYGNAHFAVLDSNRTVNYEKQVEWLRNDMNASGKTWKIVSIHTGPYNNYGKGSKAIINAMDELGIDLVLFGHNHAFLRSNPIKNGVTDSLKARSLMKDGEGTVYYSSGCAGYGPSAGGTYDNRTDDPEKMAKTYFSVLDYDAKKGPLYGAITVSEDTLAVRTYAISENKLVDEFVIYDSKSEKIGWCDINLDGSVNVKDAYYARLVAGKLIKPTDEQILLGDVDLDGRITAIDANVIRKFAVKIIKQLPV